MRKQKSIPQKKFIQLLLPLLEEHAGRYQKKTNVLARKAQEGEYIETITSDGKETINRAHKGDFLVKNKTEAGEMYILAPEEFHDKYVLLGEAAEDFSEYQAIGEVLALELTSELLKELHLTSPFYFMAKWGEKMVAKEGDFLAMPLDKSEVYRIARKEFFETYERKK